MVIDYERESAMKRAEERMAKATTLREYRDAERDYRMERLLSDRYGYLMWGLSSSLPGCWIAITLILWGEYEALGLIVSGDIILGGLLGGFTALFGLSWWSVNRYAVRAGR